MVDLIRREKKMGAAAVAEARKRTGRPKAAAPRRKAIASYKTSVEYAEWFDALLEHVRRESGVTSFSASALIEKAISEFAKSEGIDPSPKR